MLVKCDVQSCIYNDGDYCKAGTIEISLNHDNAGIGRIECSTYVYDIDYMKVEGGKQMQQYKPHN